MARYIWQSTGWPDLAWDGGALLGPLGRARHEQGRLAAMVASLGLDLHAGTIADEAIGTAAIEGERLDPGSVRSSVARRLGLGDAGRAPSDPRVDGLVDMLVDATSRHDEPLTARRLKSWQAALFPTGRSGLREVIVGRWREARMRVVSGPFGKERIHFEAPPAERVEPEMKGFLEWWRGPSRQGIDGLLRAGIAHLKFVTIHPFDDGNGRIARAITDMALAQDERTGRRPYSMSARIVAERKAYYGILESTQKGGMDVTPWLAWFLGCLERSIRGSGQEVARALAKARFWRAHEAADVSERQRKVLNRLLDAGPGGFEGGLTNRKYVGMTGASRETAKRDISDLVARGMLRAGAGRGRAASYEIVAKDEG